MVTFMDVDQVHEVLDAPMQTNPKFENDVFSDPLAKVREVLCAPFDVEQIRWLPNPKSKQLFAYAEVWDYKRRLDDVAYGAWSEPQPVVVTSATKVFVSVVIMLYGRPYGGLGEEDLTNNNAGTVAYSQAFRRACANFGLGRYMYDFGRTWADESMFAQLTKENYAGTHELGLELAVAAYKKAGIPMDERYYSLAPAPKAKQAAYSGTNVSSQPTYPSKPAQAPAQAGTKAAFNEREGRKL